MKKLVLFMMSLAVVLTACDKNPQDAPTVRFENPIETLGPGAPLSLKIVLSKAADTELTFAYSFGGTAVEDVDFSVAEDAFVVPAGEREATITLTHHNPDAATKILNVSVQAEGGYKLGNVKESLVTIAAKEDIIWSFSKRSTTLTYGSEVTVAVSLTGSVSGDRWAAANEMSIPFEVLATSTATSSQYSFKNGATAFTVAKGAKTGTLTMVAGEFPDEDTPPFIELSLNPSDDDFIEGDRVSIKIELSHTPGLQDILGTWEYASFVLTDDPEADYAMMEMLTDPDFGSGDDLEKLPKHNTSADKFTISLEGGEYKFTTSMTGDVANYFRTATISDETPVDHEYYYLNYQEFKSMECTLSSVNKLFSKTQEQLEPGVFAFSLSADGNTLYVFIYDYIATDFLHLFATHQEFPDMPPLGEMYPEMLDMAYTFTRVSE